MLCIRRGRALPAFFSCLVSSVFLPSASPAEPTSPPTVAFNLEKRAILSIQKPGYLNLVRDPHNNEWRVLVSSFQAFGRDNLFSISNWGKGLASPQLLSVARLSNEIVWPNEVRSVSPETFHSDGLIISGGFLVPGKSTGAVSFLRWDDSANPVPITTPKKGWYYHRSEEYDVNGDGLMDIITARGTIPMVGKADGELIWLENPGTAQQSAPWKEHLIARGPDVHFRIWNNTESELSNKLPLTIIATEFSSRRLTAFRQNQQGEFERHVLDETLGAGFDIQIEDLNADGHPDLLVTNHEPDDKASVFAYEIDAEALVIKRRHTLLTGIETRQKGIKQASPGTVTTFKPSNSLVGKPWILVSGDGSQRAHLLAPLQPLEENNWQYQEHIVWDAKSTVGQSVAADLDNDGKTELLIPAYDANQIAVFTLDIQVAKSAKSK